VHVPELNLPGAHVAQAVRQKREVGIVKEPHKVELFGDVTASYRAAPAQGYLIGLVLYYAFGAGSMTPHDG